MLMQGLDVLQEVHVTERVVAAKLMIMHVAIHILVAVGKRLPGIRVIYQVLIVAIVVLIQMVVLQIPSAARPGAVLGQGMFVQLLVAVCLRENASLQNLQTILVGVPHQKLQMHKLPLD